MIYFIQGKNDDAIKIGYTKNKFTLKNRLEYIQKQINDFTLKIIGTKSGTQQEEGMLHQIFNSFRIKGEWFESEKSLISFINSSDSVKQQIDKNCELLSRNKKEKEEIITTTLRIPHSIWIKLRRLQEEQKIESIHQAVLDSLEKMIKNNENN